MKQRLSLLAVAVMVVLSGAAFATWAQEEVAKIDVPFAFQAAGKMHEAGKYELRLNEDGSTIALASAKGAPSVMLAEDRLAAPDKPLTEGRVVFDKVGETYYLAEVWLPDRDGIVLHATKQKHTHHTVKIQK